MDQRMVTDQRAVMDRILQEYTLPPHGIHGVHHWARVRKNGLAIARVNGADPEVVVLFALFHDSRRQNEGTDDGHGRRGGDFARSLRGTVFTLDDDRFELLYEACCRHTDGLDTDDPTLGACWDADRLDLGRVGIVPDPRRLCTEAARELASWNSGRSTHRFQVEP